MINKYIQKLLNVLKVELFVVWIIVAGVAVLGEFGIIPNGYIPPHSTKEFELNVIAVSLTVIGVPLALQLFKLNTTKGLRRMNNDEALRSYHVWSIVRMGILCFAASFCMFVYYYASSVSCVFCTLVILAVSVYCWPSRDKISSYLVSVNNG